MGGQATGQPLILPVMLLYGTPWLVPVVAAFQKPLSLSGMSSFLHANSELQTNRLLQHSVVLQSRIQIQRLYVLTCSVCTFRHIWSRYYDKLWLCIQKSFNVVVAKVKFSASNNTLACNKLKMMACKACLYSTLLYALYITACLYNSKALWCMHSCCCGFELQSLGYTALLVNEFAFATRVACRSSLLTSQITSKL